MPLATGQVLKDRYRIVRLLGQGGFGAVYRAWDSTFDLPCALKENTESSPEAQRQFLREARLLRTMRHPNLPQVNDYFVVEGQGQYLVMDFVDGEDLQQMLDASGGPLPEAQVVEWISQVCSALEYLHAQNPPVAHRDIKPANIKITPQGKAVLVDFGIAKQFDPNRHTTKGALAVTPGYAPFEQYGQSPTDARSDIYSVGATLYHLLTGNIPVESVARMRGVTLENPRILNPALTPRVEQVVMQAMALQSEERYQSIGEMKEILQIPRTEIISIKGAEVTLPILDTPSRSTSHIKSRNAWPWFLAGGLGLIACLVIVIGMLNDVITPKSTSASVVLEEITQTPAQIITTTNHTIAEPTMSFTSTHTKTLPTETSISTSIPSRMIDEKGVEMALIPEGEFLMGAGDTDTGAYRDEKPLHLVFLDSYYIDIYEVTNTQYQKCEDSGDCEQPQMAIELYRDTIYAKHPVVGLNWSLARSYCMWRGGDLPTEAQWEKAARGGLVGKLFPWGNNTPVCTPGAENGAQYNRCDNGKVEVGSFQPNGYGLFDITGNVWEWVLDWYQDTFYAYFPLDNPMGPETGTYRVIRGGSWRGEEEVLRVSNRQFTPPGSLDDPNPLNDAGIRCVRTP